MKKDTTGHSLVRPPPNGEQAGLHHEPRSAPAQQQQRLVVRLLPVAAVLLHGFPGLAGAVLEAQGGVWTAQHLAQLLQPELGLAVGGERLAEAVGVEDDRLPRLKLD